MIYSWTVQINSQSSRSSRETSFLDFISTWKTNTATWRWANKEGEDVNKEDRAEKWQIKTKALKLCVVFFSGWNVSVSLTISHKVRHTYTSQNRYSAFICNMSGIFNGYSCSVSCHRRYTPARTSKSGLSGVDLWELQHKYFYHPFSTAS